MCRSVHRLVYVKMHLNTQELHKCSKKSAMPRDTEVKNLESVLALLEVSDVDVVRTSVIVMACHILSRI